MARVDVIIPAYNAAKYLPAAIESVTTQTFTDWRIMLVDDGSTDDTAEIASQFADQCGEKFQYIYQENKRLPAARNTAIRASSGEFLALLDADDIWLPCRLEESLKALREHPQAGLSYGLFTRIDQNGNLGATWRGNTGAIEGRIAPQIYMRKIDLPCPTMTFRRKCIEEVGMFDESMRATEDRDMWFRIALRYEVAFVPKIIAYYRTSPESMSGDPDRMLEAQKQFIRKHYGSQGCGLRQRQIALARAHKQRAEALKSKGMLGPALMAASRAVTLYPFDSANLRTGASLLLDCLNRKT